MWHVTCFGFLVNHFFLFFFLYTWDRAAPSPVDRFGRSSLTSKILKPAYKATASIPAKFCSTIKTTKCSSSLVQIRTQQFQDGGRPPFWKTVKLPYLSNRSTDFKEIWHSDAHWPPTGDTPLKFRIYKNPRWRPSPSWKSQKKIAISQQRFDRSSRNLARWCEMSLLTVQTVKNLNFKNADGGRLSFLKSLNGHISATVWAVLMKFRKLVQPVGR